MNLPYIIEAQICFALLWLVYRIFMHGSGNLAQNRVYLLTITVVSFIIPLLSIPLYDGGTITLYPDLSYIPQEGIIFFPEETVPGKIFGLGGALRLLYFSGLAVMGAILVRQSAKIVAAVKNSRRTRYGNVYIMQTGDSNRAFSFFNYIFISGDIDKNEASPIVAHEMCHVRLGHSVDSIVAQLFLVVFWWNPFVWLWKRSLKEVHEFQADQAVLNLGFDSEHYINLILGNLYGIYPEFVSGFSYSLIKKRLAMISRNEGGIYAKFRILLAAPVTALLLALFSFTEKAAEVIYAAEEPGDTIMTLNIDGEAESAEKESPLITFEITGKPDSVAASEDKDLGEPPSKTYDGKYGRLHLEFKSGDAELSKDSSLNISFGYINEQNVPVVKDSERSEASKGSGELSRHKDNVTELPVFPEGDFATWLLSNTEPPKKKKDRTGKALLTFVVERDGSLGDVQYVGPPAWGKPVREAALKAPGWKPYLINGQPVRYAMQVSLDFSEKPSSKAE